MSTQPEILFLAHRIPFPPDKGDKIRSWRLLNHLARDFRVHLACFVDDPADFAHAPRLEALCETATLIPLERGAAFMRTARGLFAGAPLTAVYFSDASMRRAVSVLRARPLAAEIVFSSTMAQYIESPVEGRPRIVDFCDADSEKFFDYAATGIFPMRALFEREGRLLGKLENTIANWADASFAITPDEAARFNFRGEIEKEVSWWANGVDTEYFNPASSFERISQPADIVFTGAMDYRANIDAAAWFANEVWPMVRDAAPDATFAIVGAKPTRAVQALARAPGVCVTGRVDDIRPWIAQSKFVVAPLRVARGIQNKVLEAMAMAKPVIATDAAATGIVANKDTEIVLANAPRSFAATAVGLLGNAARRTQIGNAARARMVADYQWDRQLSRFSAALDVALASDEASPLPASSAA